jgi:hypothetical protein
MERIQFRKSGKACSPNGPFIFTLMTVEARKKALRMNDLPLQT